MFGFKKRKKKSEYIAPKIGSHSPQGQSSDRAPNGDQLNSDTIMRNMIISQQMYNQIYNDPPSHADNDCNTSHDSSNSDSSYSDSGSSDSGGSCDSGGGSFGD